jgi:hypothetical protein
VPDAAQGHDGPDAQRLVASDSSSGFRFGLTMLRDAGHPRARPRFTIDQRDTWVGSHMAAVEECGASKAFQEKYGLWLAATVSAYVSYSARMSRSLAISVRKIYLILRVLYLHLLRGAGTHRSWTRRPVRWTGWKSRPTERS